MSYSLSSHPHLSRSVTSVPEGITQVLPCACGRVDHFQRNSGDAKSFWRINFPVRLSYLLPHYHIKSTAGLIAKHKPSIIVISVSVDVESATEIHSVELIETWRAIKTLRSHLLKDIKLEVKIMTRRATLTAHILTHCNTGVRIGRLNQLFALMSDHPVGINLCSSFGVQMYHLKLPEVSVTDGVVLRAHIQNVWNVVIVKIIFADIASSIPCR